MDADGVDVAVCLGWPFADPRLLAEQNDWLAAVTGAHPDRLIGFGCVNPADPGAAAEATRCARLGLRGLGELNADAQGWQPADCAPVLVAAAAADLVCTVHASEPVGHRYPGKGTMTPAPLEELATAAVTAGVRLVLAHAGGGLPLLAHMPEVADLCAHLWFDTAAVPFLYSPSVHGAVLAAAGPGRLLLGSDFPLLRVPRTRDHLRASGLGEADLAAVTGGAAVALLGL